MKDTNKYVVAYAYLKPGDLKSRVFCIPWITEHDYKEWSSHTYNVYKDKSLAASKKYNLLNQKQIKDYKKKYYLKNKETIRAKNKAWYEQNKVRYRIQSAIWRANNIEKIKHHEALYREKNKERIKKYQKSTQNKEKARQYRFNNIIKINGNVHNKNSKNIDGSMKKIISGLITVRKIKRIMKGHEAPAVSNIINKTGVSQ